MRRATSGTSASASGSHRLAAIALATLALAVAVAWSGAARADDVDACVSASEEGQVLRDEGRLRAARERFVACGGERCPAIVRKDCAGWLASVDEKLPSVLVRARDTNGKDLAAVRVTVDGAPLAEALDGRALAIDPGTHTFRFTTAGAPEVTQTVLLREGEKGRVLDVVLGAMGREGGAASGGRGSGEDAPGSGARPFSVPASAWVLAGVSLAGFGALAGFGVAATTAVDDMRATCAPGCAPERVDAARRDMILANVGLGAGVLALGAAAIVVVVHNTRAGTTAASAPAGGTATTRLQLSAGLGGLSASAAW